MGKIKNRKLLFLIIIAGSYMLMPLLTPDFWKNVIANSQSSVEISLEATSSTILQCYCDILHSLIYSVQYLLFYFVMISILCYLFVLEKKKYHMIEKAE